MFAQLACGVDPWYEPRGFWRAFKDFDGQPVNIREHQDGHEFFIRLQVGEGAGGRGDGVGWGGPADNVPNRLSVCPPGLQDTVDEHLRGVGRPRAIHTALGGTFAQLITVIEAPQHRSEKVCVWWWGGGGGEPALPSSRAARIAAQGADW